ncbi:MAG: type II toxin-antitoxin system VapC family toxin [Thermodesulfobacteriota bacterium]
MRALLDTCTFVWLVSSPSLVPQESKDLLDRDADAIVVSAASIWELAIKHKIGRLGELSSIARDLGDFVRQAIDTYVLDELPIATAHAALAGDLPLHHRDPFDRMLVAQARIEGLTLISPDAAFDRYEIERRWG